MLLCVNRDACRIQPIDQCNEKKENESVMEFIKEQVSNYAIRGVAVDDVTAPKFRIVAQYSP